MAVAHCRVSSSQQAFLTMISLIVAIAHANYHCCDLLASNQWKAQAFCIYTATAWMCNGLVALQVQLLPIGHWHLGVQIKEQQAHTHHST